jgi:hypothetical protein
MRYATPKIFLHSTAQQRRSERQTQDSQNSPVLCECGCVTRGFTLFYLDLVTAVPSLKYVLNQSNKTNEKMDGQCNCVNSAFQKHRKSRCLLRNMGVMDPVAIKKGSANKKKGSASKSSVKQTVATPVMPHTLPMAVVGNCYCTARVTHDHSRGICDAPAEARRLIDIGTPIATVKVTRYLLSYHLTLIMCLKRFCSIYRAGYRWFRN